MLSVDIAKTFDGFTLDVAFDAPAGITAIFGPSGSGKTSVIRAVAGLLPCERAQVTLSGVELTHLRPCMRKVGYVFQDARLFPHMTVQKNLRYGGSHDEEAVIAVLGLSALLDRSPATLSGGERQRVALGRALMSAPELLLMDEPLSALDAPRKAEVLPYIEALRDQTSIPILYVSHDMGEVARLARNIVVLNKGQVVLSGDMEDVLSDPAAVPFLGVRDAGAVLTGRVVGHADDGLTKIETGAGAVWVPGAVGRAGGTVRVRVPAQDIILSRTQPEGLSALNVLPVTIAALERGGGPGVAVALQAGDSRLLARVTKRSCDGMALQKGDRIFAILKATAIASTDVG
ncbi:molybdenum ABC transporter ATP-binding protein [Octadecabacter sp. CECT 8868]|uniref:molybdenum ABC transporter ATP-binding protein n=1 Tax=Octadecabacter algicola TaxID=2909342 RepID=UPI001F370D96|nr:molybdenum ABC transporter ATP-binding protein [Octadecabacter algicola]MCF2906325.1 molybdenum ABC transporter ATP-binding protein [Octadecabacter algicola]